MVIVTISTQGPNNSPIEVYLKRCVIGKMKKRQLLDICFQHTPSTSFVPNVLYPKGVVCAS